MKPQLFSFLVPGTWVCFWMNLWWNQASYWFWIGVLVGVGAVPCTVALLGNDGSAGQAAKRFHWGPTEGSPQWVAWVVSVCWIGILVAIARHLPEYWSQLFPLLVIIGLWSAWKLWPGLKSEGKLEDDSSQTGTGQQGQNLDLFKAHGAKE
jgi:hypothetical protein